MEVQTEPTFRCVIEIAGDLRTIRQVCRRYCLKVALCLKVSAADFLCAARADRGASVTLWGCPRVPLSAEQVREFALELARRLLHGCCQETVSVLEPNRITRLSRADELVAAQEGASPARAIRLALDKARREHRLVV